MRPPPSHEHALLEVQRPLGARRGVRIVRHHDDGLAVLAVERLQQVEDLVAGLAIEVAGRLVAEQQRRIGDDRARDADALLLAARQLARIVVHRARPSPTTDSATCTRLRRSALPTAWSAAAAARRSAPRSAPAAGCTAGRRSRCAARATPTACRPTACRSDRRRPSIDPSRRRVEPAHQVEQRRLARARRAHQRQEVPFGDVEIDALQDVDALDRRAETPCGDREPLREHSTSLHLDLVAVLERLRAFDDDPLARADARKHFHLIAVRRGRR